MASKNGKGPELATFTNEEYGTTFQLPKRPTVREQMRWTSAIAAGPMTINFATYERLWQGVKVLAKGWKCKHIPNPLEFSLDESDDPIHFEIITWACGQASLHFTALRQVKKSSSKKS